MSILDISSTDIHVDGTNDDEIHYNNTKIGTISGAASTNNWTLTFNKTWCDSASSPYTTQGLIERAISRVQYDNSGSSLTDETFDVTLYFKDGCPDPDDNPIADKLAFELTIDGV